MSVHPKLVLGVFWRSPKFPLQDKKSAARIFLGQYLSIQPGDFASPQLCAGAAHG